MHDIIAKADRVKEIYADGQGKPSELELAELRSIVIDVIAELVMNSRRIAVALEKRADCPGQEEEE